MSRLRYRRDELVARFFKNRFHLRYNDHPEEIAFVKDMHLRYWKFTAVGVGAMCLPGIVLAATVWALSDDTHQLNPFLLWYGITKMAVLLSAIFVGVWRITHKGDIPSNPATAARECFVIFSSFFSLFTICLAQGALDDVCVHMLRRQGVAVDSASTMCVRRLPATLELVELFVVVVSPLRFFAVVICLCGWCVGAGVGLHLGKMSYPPEIVAIRTMFNIGVGLLALYVLRLQDVARRKEYERTLILEVMRTETSQSTAAVDECLRALLPPALRNRVLSACPERILCATFALIQVADFPVWSSGMLPAKAVTIMASIITVVDGSARLFGMDRLWAAGDEYCVGANVFSSQAAHATLACKCTAYSILSTDNLDSGGVPIPLRAVIHTGSAIAGVVGRQRLRYDVFGDAIFMLSRIMTFTDPFTVIVSAVTQKLTDSSEVTFTPSPPIAELMGEYYMLNISALPQVPSNTFSAVLGANEVPLPPEVQREASEALRDRVIGPTNVVNLRQRHVQLIAGVGVNWKVIGVVFDNATVEAQFVKSRAQDPTGRRESTILSLVALLGLMFFLVLDIANQNNFRWSLVFFGASLVAWGGCAFATHAHMEHAALAAACLVTILHICGAILSAPNVLSNDLTYVISAGSLLWLRLPRDCFFPLRVVAYWVTLPVPIFVAEAVSPQIFIDYFRGTIQIALTFVIPLYMLVDEQKKRIEFRDRALATAVSALAKTTEEMHRRTLDATLPKAVAAFVAENRRVQQEEGATVSMMSLDMCVVLCVRFDLFSQLLSSVELDASPAAYIAAVEQSLLGIDVAMKRHCVVVNAVRTRGDTVLLAGPLMRSCDVLVFRAVLECLSVLLYLTAQQTRGYTAALVVRDAYGVVSGDDYPRYDLLGPAVILAEGLLSNAPNGSVVVDERTPDMLVAPALNDLPRLCDPVGMAEELQRGPTDKANDQQELPSQSVAQFKEDDNGKEDKRAVDNNAEIVPLPRLHPSINDVVFGVGTSWAIRGLGVTRIRFASVPVVDEGAEHLSSNLDSMSSLNMDRSNPLSGGL